MSLQSAKSRKVALDRAKHVIAHEFRLAIDEPLGALGFDFNSVSRAPESTRVTLIYEISGQDFLNRNPASSLITLDDESVRQEALALYIELDMEVGSIHLTFEHAEDLLRWLVAVDNRDLHSQITEWETNIRRAGLAIANGLELLFAAHSTTTL